MIPDVTPNGVFYLPPTGWLTSFYNPPILFFRYKSQIVKNKTKIQNPSLIFTYNAAFTSSRTCVMSPLIATPLFSICSGRN